MIKLLSSRFLAAFLALPVFATAALDAAEPADPPVVQQAVCGADDTAIVAAGMCDLGSVPEPATWVLFVASAVFAIFLRVLVAKVRADESEFLSSNDLAKIRKAYRQIGED